MTFLLARSGSGPSGEGHRGSHASSGAAPAPETSHALLDRTFFVGLILKGLNGVLELVGGTALLLAGPSRITALIGVLTQEELHEDPHDLIANALRHLAGTLSLDVTLFAAVYLLIHGLVKVVLIWAVLRDRLWAYPWLIGFLIAFIGFQGYELIVGFGWGLFALTVFDIVIVVLTWREYRLHRGDRGGVAPGAR